MDNNMKILTIFTGGTIGSHVDQSGYISTSASAPYILLEMYNNYISDTTHESLANTPIEFVSSEPYEILSENLDALHISMLIKHIHTQIKLHQDADGIIITHGTDTLQYTAAMLSYAFATINMPILLVSSAYVLSDPRANGLLNFIGAVEFIKDKICNGVFVSYSNDCQKVLFHHGTSLITPPTCSADMDSIMNSYYASYDTVRGIDINQDAISYDITEFADIDEWIHSADSIENMLLAHPPILWLHVHPGIKYPTISGSEDLPKAILLESYHSGTLCMDKELFNFANSAKSLNIPIFLIGSAPNKTEYESVKAFEDLGITVLYGMTPIAQYCKLWLALSLQLDLKSIY